MEKSSFFNSINKDRTYKAEDFAKYFSNFVGNGVFAKHGQALAVTAGEAMQVILGVGSAFINGYAYENTTPLMLDVDVADGVLKRIDRLVLRWSLQDRSIKSVLVKGQPASEPVAVELTRNSEVYELAIADVLVGQGVVEILQTAIIDQRQNSELCGYVAHMLLDFNPEGLYAQHSAIFSAFMEGVETTLQGDVAGNLLVKINQNKDKIGLLNTVYTFTLQAGSWQEVDGFFVQTVTVQGVTSDIVLEVDLVTSSTKTTVEQELEAYASIVSVTTGTDSVIVKFLEQPSLDLNLLGQVTSIG